MGACAGLKRLASVALFATWLACVTSFGQTPKNILLVYEENATIPAHVEMETALFRALHEQLGPSLEFYQEQIDTIRFPEEPATRIDELRSRYANRKIDAIIFVGSVPVEILPGVPVVYVGNSPAEQANFHVYHGPVGAVWYEVDPVKIVSVARRLQPKAHKVLVISGTAPSDLLYLAEFRSQLDTMGAQLEFEYVVNASIEQLVARLSHLSRDTIVLPVAYSRDPGGNTYVSRDAVAQLAQASTAPVYAICDTYVGTGTVGGYVINFAKTGTAAANVALSLIRGDKHPEIVQSNGTSEYMFDWRQLQRWGFSERDLPPGSAVEFRVPTAWEQYRWRIVGAVALIVVQFILISGLLIQRFRRKRAEKSLRDMTGRLLQTQDDERRRIARDLHDGTGQHLSGIALSVGQVLADFPPGHDRLRQLLQDSHVASRQALNEVRAVSYALHPPILDGLGLVPALQWYLDGLKKRTSLQINFDAPAELSDATPDTQRTLFRIVQESVTNILRHSGGTAMKVRLLGSERRIMLEIEDDGHGMSVEELQRAAGAASLGVGIAGMRERVRQLHGTFNISSSPRGTRVSVSLPTHEEQYAAHPAG
jgi:signal transduction histidine kinase